MYCIAGLYRKVKPSFVLSCFVRASSAARSVSRKSKATGFSQSTCLSASRAAHASSRCVWLGVHTSTRSMSSRPMMSRWLEYTWGMSNSLATSLAKWSCGSAIATTSQWGSRAYPGRCAWRAQAPAPSTPTRNGMAESVTPSGDIIPCSYGNT
jgi:hypothetical protein